MVLTLGESWPVLVGKRFLSLSAADGSDEDLGHGHDSWDVERVAEWPWLSGTIRAVSHTDVTKKDLKVKKQKKKTNKKNKLLEGPWGDRTFPSYLGNNKIACTLPPVSSHTHSHTSQKQKQKRWPKSWWHGTQPYRPPSKCLKWRCWSRMFMFWGRVFCC